MKHAADESRSASMGFWKRTVLIAVPIWLVMSFICVLLMRTTRTGPQASFLRYVGFVYLAPAFWLARFFPGWEGLPNGVVLAGVLIYGLVAAPLIAAPVAIAVGRPTVRKHAKPAIALAVLMCLAGFILAYPRWRAIRVETHKMFHDNPCKTRLWEIAHYLMIEIDAWPSPWESDRSPGSPPPENVLFAALKKVLIANPELGICPYRHKDTPPQIRQAIESARTPAELEAIIDYHINLTLSSWDDVLMWDKSGNHPYTGYLSVMRLPTRCIGLTPEEFAERYPRLASRGRYR